MGDRPHYLEGLSHAPRLGVFLDGGFFYSGLRPQLNGPYQCCIVKLS